VTRRKCGADSLVMADRAVAMAEAGCTTICVLGVDFMSENVRAILDAAGHKGVAVYRMDAASIGCTLAEAAESHDYLAWLDGAQVVAPRSVHVVYINTSLRTKALAHHRVPTITCTSSNVVRTVLQAFAQVCGSAGSAAAQQPCNFATMPRRRLIATGAFSCSLTAVAQLQLRLYL
jgi:quinolinate synthase